MGEQAANKGAYRETDIDRGHVDADHATALFGRKDRGEDGHAGGDEHPCAQTLHHPQPYQPFGTDGKGSCGSAQGVDDQTDAEDPLATVDVGQLSSRNQGDRDGQQIGSGYPAQLDGIHFEIPLDSRQGHIDRRYHERSHKGGQGGNKKGGTLKNGWRLRLVRRGLHGRGYRGELKGRGRLPVWISA